MNHAYLVMGHGTEDVEGPGITVPDDVIVVTLAVCGNSTDYPEVCPYLRGFSDPSNETILKNPIKYKKELETKFGSPIHIYKAGMNMPFFSVQYYALMPDENVLVKSGVYEFPMKENLKIRDDLQKKDGICPEFTIKDIDPNTRVSQEIYDEAYKGSLYPDHNEIYKNIVQITTTLSNGSTSTRNRFYRSLKGPFTFSFLDVLNKLQKSAVYYYVICRAPFTKTNRGQYKYGTLQHPLISSLPEPVSSHKYINIFSFTTPDDKDDSYTRLVNFMQDPEAEIKNPSLYYFLKSLYIQPQPHETNEVKLTEKVVEKMRILKNINVDKVVPIYTNNNGKIIKDDNYKLHNSLEDYIAFLTNSSVGNMNKYINVLNKMKRRRVFSNAQQFYQLSNENIPQTAFNMPKPFGKGGKRKKKTHRIKRKQKKSHKQKKTRRHK